ncbi:asparagine synthetase B family protein [uncultured Parabacteroides sp.]|uniref:asparagine synthase-related protein n=4 Tax=uncultured Parabacteroides sp. TaxID=512312 RepID=UPI0026391CB8|nr:asparagine synthetase B family protein [uncultured Parabacteroides sp.]
MDMFVGSWNRAGELPEMPQVEPEEGFAYKGNCQRCQRNKTCIWFFGELYNKKELGYGSSDDAETFFCIYDRKGIQGLACLDGAFTCIVKTPDSVLIVRDRHGLADQVYYTDRYFASSLSLLKSTTGFEATPNYQALSSFLLIGYIVTPFSAFSNVRKLGAGEVLTYRDGHLESNTLFPTDAVIPVLSREKTLDAYAEEYAALHAGAIRKRIGESTNVGILLSGGYDSGCNLAALRSLYNGDIRSYSIGFKGDNWTELPLARCMSETFRTIHSEYEIDGSEIEALPDLVEQLGDPFVEGGLMVNYAVMRLIGQDKPDVILGGDGSDQYFGTSGREVALHYLISRFGMKPVVNLLYKILSRPAFDRDATPYRIRFHLDKILHILDGDLFGFPVFQLEKLLKDHSFLHSSSLLHPDMRSFEHLYTQHTYKCDMEKIINQVILFKASKIADMFGNRLVFPYMDLDLYTFLMQLPVCYKCKGDNVFRIAKGETTAKYLLKYHYKPMLPEAITTKIKQGGFAPMPIFFRDNKQRARIADYILSSSVVSDFLNRDYVEKFIVEYDKESHETGNWFWYKQNRAIQYFNLLALSVWWEKFIKQGNQFV